MPSTVEKLKAWSVHLYTATGMIIAAVMAVMIIRGGESAFRSAIGMMILATLIDATDGALARRWRVREVLPGFDGRRLDDIIDYQTYTSLPILFMWRAGVVPESYGWWLVVPLLASLYGFSQTEAKTDDHLFLGFPSYWNVVAIYLYWLSPPVWLSLVIILLLSILTFVPSFYLYPSYRGHYSRLTRATCLIWVMLLILIVTGIFSDPGPVILASAAFPALYMILSWSITVRRWSDRTRANQGE
jgi:phosphatidylcholine synthase